MSDDVVKVPIVNLEIPKPRPWDLVALVVVILALVATAANIKASGITQAGTTPATGLTLVFVTVHFVIGLGSLMLLGKTAKEGTIHGNLLSITGMLLGLSGVLLAAALWVAA